MRSRRSGSRRDDLADFRRDDSPDAEPVRRELYQWRGDEGVNLSSRRLPPPFVKSVDYEPVSEVRMDRPGSASDGFPAAARPPSGPARGVSIVSYGPQKLSMRSLLRPTFTGSANPCAARRERREVLFAAGKGGKRLGTKKVRRTSDSERSC